MKALFDHYGLGWISQRYSLIMIYELYVAYVAIRINKKNKVKFAWEYPPLNTVWVHWVNVDISKNTI